MLRGIGVLSIAQAVAMGCAVLTAALLARAIGPEGYGIIGFGVAVISFFGIAVTLGTDTLGSREIARTPSRGGVVLGTILSFRFLLLILFGAVFVGVCFGLDRTPIQRTVLMIQGIGILVTVLTLDFLFQGLNKLSFIAARQIIASLLVLAGVFLFVHQPGDVVAAAWVFVAAGLVSVLAVFPAAVRLSGGMVFDRSKENWRRLLYPAMPLALTGAMNTVLFNTDTVMLGLMVDAHDVGLYSAAFRVLMVALVPAGIIQTVFHPRLSAVFGNSDAMRHTLSGFFVVLLFAGFPITVAGMCLAEPTIRLLFGSDFLEAAPVLTILMGAGMLAYVRMISGPALLAWDAEKLHLKVTLIGATANVALNLVLIPMYGVVGAAVASLISQAGIALGFWLVLRSKVDGVSLMPAFRLLAGAVIAGAAGWAVLRYFPLATLEDEIGAGTLLFQGAVTISVVFLLACRILRVRWFAALKDGRY